MGDVNTIPYKVRRHGSSPIWLGGRSGGVRSEELQMTPAQAARLAMRRGDWTGPTVITDLLADRICIP